MEKVKGAGLRAQGRGQRLSIGNFELRPPARRGLRPGGILDVKAAVDPDKMFAAFFFHS